jgi:hypothetical protein
MRARYAAVCGVLVAALAACGCGKQPDSGVSGTVRESTGCPAVRVGQTCPAPPTVAVHLEAIRFPSDFVGVPMPAYGKVMAHFASGANGHFRVPLPPGDYELWGSQQVTHYIGGCSDPVGWVVVPAHQWVHADVVCETGAS